MSRIFRRIFESNKIKRTLGANLAMFMVVSSTLKPTPEDVFAESPELNSVHTQIVLTTNRETRYPVKNVRVNQKYNIFHQGIDFGGQKGDPIYPFSDGVIEKTENTNYGYGKSVYIRHNSGKESLYAHLSQINVKEGDFVTTNDVIGLMGSTGRSTGNHLHFEIRENGKNINPLTVLPEL